MSPEEPTQRIALRLLSKHLDRLDQLAEARGTNRSEALRHAIETIPLDDEHRSRRVRTREQRVTSR